ncbi:MAG: hypothetical protein Q4E24_01550 [bacterium]|nr:hypothetical protein [bacterium]
MKKHMKKVLVASLLMSVSMHSLVYAGEWKQDNIGWWWQEEDGSYPTNSWKWLDGNKDGIAECYYFGDQGYMLANTAVEGYTVNADGAWTVDGEVQVQTVEYDNDAQNQAQQEEKAGEQLSRREKLEAAQDRLYEVEYASLEERKEVLYDYFEILGVDPTGLIIEEDGVKYVYSSFGGGDSTSRSFFQYPDVLTSIMLYMGERKEGIDTISTSEGKYSFPAYLIVMTRRAASALK